VATLVQERTKILGELGELCDFFFMESLSYSPTELVPKGMDTAATIDAMKAVREALETAEPWDATALESVTRPICERLGLTAKQLFGVLRVALTGRTAAPPLFDTMEVLGRTRCLRRLADATQTLESLPNGLN
jgi:glutamyl-tRNA synthetase